ncbi:MAG: DUF4238 domain-containing protein [Hyphomonadaceae bacterium]|nr:DUF4238 domain-containing protein [Hyphomonadaceae bacterium]
MRHHYVPQFLLRPWAEPNADKKVVVYRFDLPELRHSRWAPKAVGYEDDLYALTRERVAGMERHAIENRLLSHIDNAAATVRDKLLSRGLTTLTVEERCDWIRFLVSLRMRQPHMVAALKEGAATELRRSMATDPEEYEVHVGASDPPTLEAWAEQRYPGIVENFGLSFFHELVDSPVVGKKIFDMKWWVWDVASAGSELLLADHPCIFSAGIDDPDLLLAMPISPTKVFSLHVQSVRPACCAISPPSRLCKR